MNVLLRSICVFLLCSVAFGMRFYESHSHKSLPSKRKISNVISNKRGGLMFNNEAPPKITLARPHESLTLECQAKGSPTPTIHWLKDGQRIEQGIFDNSLEDEASLEYNAHKRGQRLLQLGITKSKLFLDCLSEAHRGQYTCVTETPYRRISRSTDLEIDNSLDNLPMTLETQSCLVKRSMKDEPARIYLWTANRVEMEGADVQFFCRATGYPKPVITWFDREGNLVQKGDSRYKVLKNGDLVIYKISWEENRGLYHCIATNPTGTDKVDTFLYPTTP